jgi:histidinol dehydrogenase
MSNYLVVAHQTANSEELADALLTRKEKDADAEFVLLVPATRIEELHRLLENDRRANAERVAVRALLLASRRGRSFEPYQHR